jgi:hypothetical protein
MAPGDFSGSYFLGARAAPALVFGLAFIKNIIQMIYILVMAIRKNIIYLTLYINNMILRAQGNIVYLTRTCCLFVCFLDIIT